MDLVDPFGRTIRDLRISVTDRCNFRCTYCMPDEGMVWVPRSEVLTFEEIERLARIFVERFDVDGLRLTGGEPTVRAHLPVLVGKLAALRVPSTSRSSLAGRAPDMGLTTNGATFRLVARDLRKAGLDRVNISLDTLRADRFVEMTRRDELVSVLDGIEAAKEAGFAPVKINAVVQRGVNDDEIVDLARFGREHDVEVRFIEFMPLDAEQNWQSADVLDGAAIRRILEAEFGPLRPVERPHSSQPASDFEFADGGGRIGLIQPVSQPFCEACDRLRLTAEGQVRNCLFSTAEWDARAILRGGGSDDEHRRHGHDPAPDFSQ